MTTTNTQQHTPAPYIAILWPYLFNGIKAKDVSLQLIDDAEAHAKKADKETAGNAFFKYIPLSLAVSAPELLKENQEMKAEVKKEQQNVVNFQELYLTESRKYGQLGTHFRRLEALNAELLEALKGLTEFVEQYANTTDVSGYLEAANSAIAKAEGK